MGSGARAQPGGAPLPGSPAGPTPDAPVPRTQRRRRTRLEPGQVRARMIAAGRALVREQQLLTAGLEDLGMEDVIVRADVPRGSVYRIWPYRADFLGELLVALATPEWFGPDGFDRETAALTGAVLLEHWDLVASRAVVARRAVLREAVLVAATHNAAEAWASESWRVATALSATVRTVSDLTTRDRVAAALEESDHAFRSTLALFYRLLCDLTGARLTDPSRTFDQVALAIMAVVEGMGLRHLVTVASPDPDRPATGAPWEGETADLLASTVRVDGAASGRQEWGLVAATVLTVLESHLELVPAEEFSPLPREELAALVRGLGGLVADDGDDTVLRAAVEGDAAGA